MNTVAMVVGYVVITAVLMFAAYRAGNFLYRFFIYTFIMGPSWHKEHKLP